MEEEEWRIGNGKVSLFAFCGQRPSSLPFPLPPPFSIPPSPARTPFWLWPHVFSLEAPVVAMLWLAALARVDRLALMPGVMAGLGLAVWLVYLADRILDAWGLPAAVLDLRHRFYRQFRWPLMLLAMPAAVTTLAWLGLWVVPAGLLAHSLAQVLPIALYLVLYSVSSLRLRRWLLQAGVLLLLLFVNALPISAPVRMITSSLVIVGSLTLLSLRWHEHMDRFFRKELAAGILFAFGCTTWTRFHTLGNEGPDTWLELILLSLLFVCNLSLINSREHLTEDNAQESQATVRGGLVLAVLALAAMPAGLLPLPLLPLTVAVTAGLAGLEILWWKRLKLSPEAFRVWADVVTAMPAAGLLLWPVG